MRKIHIHGEIEFLPDEAGVREVRLMDLVEEHMGKDMREVLEEYMTALDEIDRLEMENRSLEERLEDAEGRIDLLREALEERRR